MIVDRLNNYDNSTHGEDELVFGSPGIEFEVVKTA